MGPTERTLREIAAAAYTADHGRPFMARGRAWPALSRVARAAAARVAVAECEAREMVRAGMVGAAHAHLVRAYGAGEIAARLLYAVAPGRPHAGKEKAP